MKISSSFLVVFLTVILLNTSFAQTELYGENPEECKQRMSIMTAYYKQKAYAEAAPSWRILLATCPQSTKNVYIVGNKIMKDLIAKTTDAALKEKQIDTLLMLHDMRIQYFPENQVNKFRAKKATDLLYYRPKTGTEEAFKIFELAVNEGVSELENVDLEYYIISYKSMVQSNKKSCSDFITAYLKTIEILNKNTNGVAPELISASIQKVNDNSNFCLDCKILDSLYLAGFEVNKNDTAWLDKGLELLNNKKCNNSTAKLKMLEKRFTTKPSANIAALLGAYYYGEQKKEKAEFYFDKAIDLETSDEKKGAYVINKAKLYLSNAEYAQAKNTATKALSFPGTSYEAYLIMGDAVAATSNSCKNLTFGGREVFWVAVDYYKKASNAAVDASDKATANKRIAKYSTYFPEKSELFLKSLSDGNSYRVECWVTETTTVRSK